MTAIHRIAAHQARVRQAIGKRLVRPEPGIPLTAAAPFLPSDPVIVEAGAASGQDLSELLEVWPAARIHAFEPEPTAYAELRRRAEGLPTVHAWNLALGTEDGSITLNVSDGGSYGTMCSSVLEPAQISRELPELSFTPVAVEQRTLDSWAAAHEVHHVDLFTLDMQGFERAALAASIGLLQTARVVLTEAFLRPLYDGAATVDQLQALLADCGFVILQTNIFWGTTHEIMAVRRDVLDDAVRDGRLGHRPEPAYV